VTVFNVVVCRNASILNREGVWLRIMTEQPVGGCSWIYQDDVIALAVQTGMKHSMILIHIIQVERMWGSLPALQQLQWKLQGTYTLRREHRDPRQLNPQSTGTELGGSEDTGRETGAPKHNWKQHIVTSVMDFRDLFMNTGGSDSVYAIWAAWDWHGWHKASERRLCCVPYGLHQQT
jgi:hypothetical protein